MKSKHQRLILVLVALTALIGAGLFAASALKDEAAYFYTPGDARKNAVEPGRAIRLGGLVVPGSLTKAPDGITIRFEVSDGKASVPATFSGIAPDLFREGSGVIAEGAFDKAPGDGGTFVATELLAKHDERYMPRELEGLSYDAKTHRMDKTP